MEPPVRIELTTYALQVRCSTTELGRRIEGVIMTRKNRCLEPGKLHG
jgi:hypothetical protein